MPNQKTRGLRRTLTGTVTSTKMANTITVLVQRTYKHPKYGKYMRRNNKYHAHDAGRLPAWVTWSRSRRPAR